MTGWLAQTADYWASGGPLLVPIALVSLLIWGLFLRSREIMARTIREGTVMIKVLDKKDVPGSAAISIAGLLESTNGGIAALSRTVVSDVSHGAAPREAFAARESECINLMRKDLVILSALTAVAPLLGLLGTVMGMVATFDAVKSIGGDTGIRVADGISQALITTQFGLVVAMPGVFGLARLQRMLRNIEGLMAECRSHLLQIIEVDVMERRMG